MNSFEPFQNSDTPRPRIEVEKMHAYKAPLEGRRNLLRLDFNENTIGPSPRVLQALRSIPSHQISIYPEYKGLQATLIGNLKNKYPLLELGLNQIGIFNGVDAAIHAIFHAYGDREEILLTTTPTFGYYEPCANMQGMCIHRLPYEGTEFKFPFEKIKSSLLEIKPKILIICNPNNPTGTRLAAEKIQELAIQSPKTLVVIDELYEAFTGDSMLKKVDFKKTKNLLVLQSLSKTAGLAGLRIGFAIGNQEIVERISKVTGPYDVNSFAVIAALTALGDQQYVDSYVEEVLLARNWIANQLKISQRRHHLAGGNYFLIWPHNEPYIVESSLRKKGILVRNMQGKDLINGSLRVSIGTTRQMQHFWEIFSQIDII